MTAADVLDIHGQMKKLAGAVGLSVVSTSHVIQAMCAVGLMAEVRNTLCMREKMCVEDIGEGSELLHVTLISQGIGKTH